MINQNHGSRNLIALFVGMDDDDDEQIPLVVRVANKDMRQACEDGAELLYEAYVMRLDRLVSLFLVRSTLRLLHFWQVYVYLLFWIQCVYK